MSKADLKRNERIKNEESRADLKGNEKNPVKEKKEMTHLWNKSRPKRK